MTPAWRSCCVTSASSWRLAWAGRRGWTARRSTASPSSLAQVFLPTLLNLPSSEKGKNNGKCSLSHISMSRDAGWYVCPKSDTSQRLDALTRPVNLQACG